MRVKLDANYLRGLSVGDEMLRLFAHAEFSPSTLAYNTLWLLFNTKLEEDITILSEYGYQRTTSSTNSVIFFPSEEQSYFCLLPFQIIILLYRVFSDYILNS